MSFLFLANAWGWILAHGRLIAACLGAFLLILAVGIVFNRCNQRTVRIDEENLQKINSRNEATRKAELQKVIEENQTVINDVENRTTLAEANRVERERKIDEKIAEVDKKIEESKKQGKDVTQSELICLLQPETCK